MTSPLVRFGAPVLLFIYGTLRLIDGWDGHHDRDGALWNIGHTCFFAAFVLLAVLAVHLYRTLRTRLAAGGLAAGGLAAALFGAVCFLWVIVGDVFASFPELPGPLQIAGPALFQVGTLILLVLLVVRRLVPVWSPVLVVAAFAVIGVSLDLIPVAAVLLFAGLMPLAREHPAPMSSGA